MLQDVENIVALPNEAAEAEEMLKDDSQLLQVLLPPAFHFVPYMHTAQQLLQRSTLAAAHANISCCGMSSVVKRISPTPCGDQDSFVSSLSLVYLDVLSVHAICLVSSNCTQAKCRFHHLIAIIWSEISARGYRHSQYDTADRSKIYSFHRCCAGV